MKKVKIKLSGEEGFHIYYKGVYGDRWEQLCQALHMPPRQVPFYAQNESSNVYFLDAASIAAAISLPLTEAHCILDMCAAPGGKSLILASRMDENTTLTANERSRDRRDRLVRVLDAHLNPLLRARIRVSTYDGALWARYGSKDTFDRILLDAPCSSERHVLSSPAHLAQWTQSRIRNVCTTQWSLLSSAFLTLVSGGYILYSTCALTTDENDGVIAKLLKKYPNAHIIDSVSDNIQSYITQDLHCNPEKTEFGFHILPDSSNGAGPIYFSLVQKNAENRI